MSFFIMGTFLAVVWFFKEWLRSKGLKPHRFPQECGVFDDVDHIDLFTSSCICDNFNCKLKLIAICSQNNKL